MKLPFGLRVTRGAPTTGKSERSAASVAASMMMLGASSEDLSVSGKDLGELLKMAVENPWEWGAIAKIAESAAMARCIFKQDDDEGDRIKDHPWLSRFENPNDWLSDFDLWESTFGYLEGCGTCYWILRRSTGNPPEIEVPIPSRLKVIRGDDPKKRISHYLYFPDGDRGIPEEGLKIRREDVVHFRKFNPLDTIDGLPPQVPLNKNLKTDRYATEYNLRFFKNGANISGVLETDDELGQEGVNRLRRQFAEQYAGVENAFTPLVLEGGLKWKQTGAAPKDMEFLQGRKYDRETMLGYHGTPPVLMGVLEHANYSNVDAQHDIFWKDKIAPLQMKIAATLRRFLRRETGDTSLYVEFDNSKVPSLQDPIKTKVYVMERAYKLAVISRDEAREMIGLKPDPNGDTLTPDKPVTPSSNGALANGHVQEGSASRITME